jgi:tripartite ATP-independent transporter DctM subunit
LAYYAGLGQKLYSVAYRIMGRVPGGLAMSSVLACVVFGAVCGSNPATTATIGSIAIPEMRKYKYKDTLSTGSIAASGAIGAMIPPSVIFIIYGTSTQISVSRLFLSGIIPGLLLASFYILTIWILVKRNPELAPIQLTDTGEHKKQKVEAEGLLEVGIVFVVSLGGLFAGWFTPTEAGAIGAAGVLVITVIRRQIDWKGISLALRATTRTTAMIMFLIAGATIFGRLVAVSRIPFALATYVGNLELPNFVIILFTMAIYLILGTFLDTIPCILLTIPIFYPVIVGQLGNDPIWFGVFILMVSSMGVVTPPVGINVYVVKGLAKDIPIETIFRGVMPFLLAAFILTLLIIIFPQIATFLPTLLLGP